MTDPKIASKKPVVLELEPGNYFWCTCGQSANQPWCDGGHRGSEFRPMKVEIQEKKRVALCLCKHSQGKPFCDGSHSKL